MGTAAVFEPLEDEGSMPLNVLTDPSRPRFVCRKKSREANSGWREFSHRPSEAKNEEVRQAAHDLACSMDDRIDSEALKSHLEASNPELARLLNRKNSSRPDAKGDWEQVMRHGFAGAPLPDGKRNDRRQRHPAYFGDGTLRFRAIADIDFVSAGAQDIADLLDATLT